MAAIPLTDVMRDSPMLRASIQDGVKDVERLGKSLSDVSKAASVLHAASTAYADAMRGFGASLLRSLPGNSVGRANIDTEARFNGAVSQVSTGMDEMAAFADALGSQISDVFLTPLTGLVGDAEAVAKDGAKAWGSRLSAVDTAVAKFSKLSRNASEADAEKARADMAGAREAFASEGLDFVEALNDVAAAKHTSLLEHLLALLYSFSAYHNRCHAFMEGEMAPFMGDLNNQLVADRASYDRIKAEMRAASQAAQEGGAGDTPGSSSRSGGGMAGEGVSFAGYLNKRSSSFLKDFKRRYFTISAGQFVYFKNNEVSKPIHAVNTLLCSVKIPDPAATDRRSCFEVITPQRSYLLQAENDDERDAWITAIQTATAQQLNHNQVENTPSRSTPRGGLGTPTSDLGISPSVRRFDRFHDDPGASNSSLGSPGGGGGGGGGSEFADEDGSDNPQLSLLWEADSENRRCVDCGVAAPKWCSLNIGLLTCLQCSGGHRSLGTHITKVRSLELDALDTISLHVLASLGNGVVNDVFESDQEALGAFKVDGVVDHSLARDFIALKYRDHAFAALPSGALPETHMLTSIAANDPHGILQCLASADAEILIRSIQPIPKDAAAAANIPEDVSVAPLHLAIALDHIWIVEFLLQNLADVDIQDSRGWTPLHYSAQIDSGAAAGLLIRRSAKLEVSNHDDQVPLDVALLFEAANTSTLLRFAKMSLADRDASFLNADSPFMMTWNTLMDEACAIAAGRNAGKLSARRRKRRRRHKSRSRSLRKEVEAAGEGEGEGQGDEEEEDTSLNWSSDGGDGGGDGGNGGWDSNDAI